MLNRPDDIFFGYSEIYNIAQTNPVNKAWIKRKSFWCLYVTVKPSGLFAQETLKEASIILPHLNLGQANTSLNRNKQSVEADNLSGILAERVCKEFFLDRYGPQYVTRKSTNSSVNQIDIQIVNKTVEVRSSCIRNGINFAIFKRDSVDINKQYVDVIGPYINQYKPSELGKDYYLRVIYPMGISCFMKMWNNNQWISLYITGGATRNMMYDSNLVQNKHLTPKNSDVTFASDYSTIPLGRSLDFWEFIAVLERENPELTIYNKTYEKHNFFAKDGELYE